MIEFRNVALSFNGKQVLKNLSLHIRSGDKVVILGRSGTGKSSLFSLILGFVPARAGQICFDGLPVDEKSVWAVRKKVAFVDQAVSINGGTTFDWLHYVSGLKANVPFVGQKEKIRELFDHFELPWDVLQKEVDDLSGGERQRVALIISLLLERSVYFLDEATSALDRGLKEKVARYFFGKEPWTVVVISHDPVWLTQPSAKIFDLETGTWKQ